MVNADSHVVVAAKIGNQHFAVGGCGLGATDQTINNRTGGQHQDTGHQQRFGQPFQKS